MEAIMTDIEKLKESMHALVTPEFTGTHEEMIGAVGYWVSIISQLRSLFQLVTSYENRNAIITQLEKEVGIMKAELENLSAKVATDTVGQSSMIQPVPIATAATVAATVAAQAEPKPPMVDPVKPQITLATEEILQRLRANAGVKIGKAHPLSRIG